MFQTKRKSEKDGYISNDSTLLKNILTKPDIRSEFFSSNEERLKRKNIFNNLILIKEDKKKEDKVVNLKKTQVILQNKYFQEYQNQLTKEKENVLNKKRYKETVGYNSELMGYDPITLKYNKNKKGQQMYEQEKMSDLRKLIRLKNLEGQSCRNFDLVTGLKKSLINVPQDILDRYKDAFFSPDRKVRVYEYDFHHKFLQ